MKALFFPGCTVPVRNLNYELAARKVAQALDLELVDEPGFGCCGFPLRSLAVADSLLLAARNLALAGASGLPLVTLCSACAGTLAEAAHSLDHDEAVRDQVNEQLAQLGLSYTPGQRVFHFIRFLVTEVGLDRIEAKVVRSLKGWRFSPHYGCHYLKPSQVSGGFDDPHRPVTLKRLIEITGAESIDDGRTADCCGGGLLGLNEELANKMSLSRLKAAGDREVDGLVLICPFCNVMLEGQQKKIGKQFDLPIKVPIFFYPQILGLALGYSPDELGFKLNRVKNKELAEAFG